MYTYVVSVQKWFAFGQVDQILALKLPQNDWKWWFSTIVWKSTHIIQFKFGEYTYFQNWDVSYNCILGRRRPVYPTFSLPLTVSYWWRFSTATLYNCSGMYSISQEICFLVVMQSFIMNSHEVFIHIHQGCSAGTGAIVRLLQRQWSKPGGYGKISQCITTTKHSKAKTVCIFLGIYSTRLIDQSVISGRD